MNCNNNLLSEMNCNNNLLSEMNYNMLSEELMYRFFSERFEKNRPDMFDIFNKVYGDDWAIAGGTVRDHFFGYTPNDYDVIVQSEEKPLELLRLYLNQEAKYVTHNNFDGLQFETYDGIEFDVWRLRDTWGIKHDYIANQGFQSYQECCAFTTDAGIICPNTEEFHLGYMVESFNRDKIDLIFDVSPIPMRTAVKAWRLKHRYSLNFSDEVKQFIQRASVRAKREHEETQQD